LSIGVLVIIASTWCRNITSACREGKCFSPSPAALPNGVVDSTQNFMGLANPLCGLEQRNGRSLNDSIRMAEELFEVSWADVAQNLVEQCKGFHDAKYSHKEGQPSKFEVALAAFSDFNLAFKVFLTVLKLQLPIQKKKGASLRVENYRGGGSQKR